MLSESVELFRKGLEARNTQVRDVCFLTKTLQKTRLNLKKKSAHFRKIILEVMKLFKPFFFGKLLLDCPRMAEITGLLADSGELDPSEGRAYKAFLCSLQRGMQYCQ